MELSLVLLHPDFSSITKDVKWCKVSHGRWQEDFVGALWRWSAQFHFWVSPFTATVRKPGFCSTLVKWQQSGSSTAKQVSLPADQVVRCSLHTLGNTLVLLLSKYPSTLTESGFYPAWLLHCLQCPTASVWIAPFNTLMYIYHIYTLNQEMPGALIMS